MPFHGLFHTPAIPDALQSSASDNDSAVAVPANAATPVRLAMLGQPWACAGCCAEQMGRDTAPLLSVWWRPDRAGQHHAILCLAGTKDKCSPLPCSERTTLVHLPHAAWTLFFLSFKTSVKTQPQPLLPGDAVMSGPQPGRQGRGSLPCTSPGAPSSPGLLLHSTELRY